MNVIHSDWAEGSCLGFRTICYLSTSQYSVGDRRPLVNKYVVTKTFREYLYFVTEYCQLEKVILFSNSKEYNIVNPVCITKGMWNIIICIHNQHRYSLPCR